VRLTRGLYKGDLAQVYSVPEAGADSHTMIRMIPRIKYRREGEEGKTMKRMNKTRITKMCSTMMIRVLFSAKERVASASARRRSCSTRVKSRVTPAVAMAIQKPPPSETVSRARCVSVGMETCIATGFCTSACQSRRSSLTIPLCQRSKSLIDGLLRKFR
jgi:hypothetical protein